MAEEGKKISFGFAKSIKKPLLKNVQPQAEKKVDYIESIDDKAIKVIGKEEPKDEPLVIPLIGTKTWHDRIINKVDADIFEPKASTNTNSDSKELVIKTEPNTNISNGNTTTKAKEPVPAKVKPEAPEKNETPAPSLDELAAREILKDLNATDDEVKKTKVLTLPMGEDSLRGQAESTLEDYEQIPVNEFGFAMLRGMGWQPGKGIGKNEKIVEAVMPELRPKGMGLGADKVAKQKQISSAKGKQEEDLKVEKGSFVKIIVGKHSNSYGQIEGLDDDAGRVIVKMALGGNLLSLNEFMVQPVTKAEFSKNSKVLNSKKYEEYKNKEKARDQKYVTSESDVSEDSDEDRKERRKVERKEEVKIEAKKSKKHRAKEESRSRKRHSSESDSDRDRERSRRKRKSSSSDNDAPKSKVSKSSKKHKHRDDSPKRSSKKSRKNSRDRDYKEDKKYRDSKSSDKRKHKKHKRSRSRSPKKR